MKKRKSHFVQKLAILILSILLLLGAYTKLAGSPGVVALYNRLNLAEFRTAFGILQIIILLTLWWRPTRMLSTLLASAYYGAGVVMMFTIGKSALLAGFSLILVWIIHKLNWWGMWHHGYWCGCKVCDERRNSKHNIREWCDCSKPGCKCERGNCDC